MPRFTIRTEDHLFSAKADLEEWPDAETALDQGVRSALMICIEELRGAVSSIAIRVTVDDEHGNTIRKSIVHASVAYLTLKQST